MNSNPVRRLPPALEAAVQRVKMTARGAADRTVESLGLAALASNNVFQRDNLLGAQFELNRKAAVFVLAFNDALDDRVIRECLPRSDATGPMAWDALSLVEDREVEVQVTADRFALEIAHACEWELRELDGYMGSLLGTGRPEQPRNPLRPEVIGQAMIRAIDATSERPEIRKVLVIELGRSLAGMLRSTYTDIVADLRQAGVQPAGLSVKTSESRGSVSGYDTSSRPAGLDSGRAAVSTPGSLDSRSGGRSTSPGGFGSSTTRSHIGSRSGHGGSLGHVDPALMTLIRRLAFVDVARDSGIGGWSDVDTLVGQAANALPPNLIRAHREELRQASTGSLDHMVIDVIGSLFDQILSDPKVPPQMARQIGRLQLPVLRAALGDPSFFSSRRHPVRRFVNRVASLGAAYEDFDDEGAQRFLAKVRELVQQVVEGDFDQIDVYEQKLALLEAFVAEQASNDVNAESNTTELLSSKEDELRLRRLYAQQLQGELKGLAAPEFVRDFISQTWSQVLIKAADLDGPDSARVQRLRHAGRELFMSVQPKASTAQRKAFIAELPKLMKELGEGLDLISWPEPARRSFFGQLLPAHAESLKAQGLRTLDFNMLAKQVDGALDKPVPSRADLKNTPHNLPVLSEEIILPGFSAEEAKKVGLIQESSVDWNGQVDIDLTAEPAVSAVDIDITGLPPMSASEPAEPTSGLSLANHVQIGFAYQMHLEGEWHKVRLNFVSPGRTFFVFTHGQKHKQTVSLTHRMLARMCESGRMRAFESAYLLERATARARRQLAAMSGAAATA